MGASKYDLEPADAPYALLVPTALSGPSPGSTL